MMYLQWLQHLICKQIIRIDITLTTIIKVLRFIKKKKINCLVAIFFSFSFNYLCFISATKINTDIQNIPSLSLGTKHILSLDTEYFAI